MMTDPLDALPPVATAVARSPADIDALLATGEPVRIEGALTGWPALAAGGASPAALDAYLRRHDSGALVPVMDAGPASGGRFGYAADLREFSFTKRSRPLGETLHRIACAATDSATGTIAIQMLPLDIDMPGFAADNPMPLVPSAARLANVFADDGAAHLPEARRGALGLLTPSIRAALRQRLRSAALKS
jgi:hypothetical protein